MATAACGEIESRCVNIIARLFHAPMKDAESQALGVSTIGSSEAIILSVCVASYATLSTRIDWCSGTCSQKALAKPPQGSWKTIR